MAPVDVNGITKYATEQLHLLYHDVYGLRASAVRLTNVFGPRQRLRDDLQGFLPIFVRRALADDAITVFGEGEQERDCLYVDDVVECLLLTALASDAAGQIFNVGQRRAPVVGRHRRRRRARRRLGPRRARSLAPRPRRDRHRFVLRRLVEGEAGPRMGAPYVVRRRDRPDAWRSTARVRSGTCDRRRLVAARSRSSTSPAAPARSSPSSPRPSTASCGRARTSSGPSSPRSKPSSPRSPAAVTRSAWRRAPTRSACRWSRSASARATR